MITKEIRKVRCSDALTVLSRYNEAVFFTLTTPDEVDFIEIRRRWRMLRHSLLRCLRRRYPDRVIHYVMNYELHPGYLQKVVCDSHGERVLHGSGRSHGWHIHGVFNCFVPLDVYRLKLNECGFGRVDVRRVRSSGVSDYLTKHALKAYSGLSRREREMYKGSRRRLVNTSRGLPALNDYAYCSAHLDSLKGVMSQRMSEIRECRSVCDDPASLRADYRIVRARSEVCAVLGLSHYYDFAKVLEYVQSCGVKGLPGFVSRLQWRGVFQQAEVANAANGVHFSKPKRFAVREGVLSERRNAIRKNAAVRSRETFCVKEKSTQSNTAI